MRLLLASGFCLLLAGEVGCSRRPMPDGAKPDAEAPAGRPAPKQAEATPQLAGRWLLTFPNGVKHEAVVVIQEADPERFHLDTPLRLKGLYERQGGRFVMVRPAAKGNEGFVWEIRGHEELTLVAQPPHLKFGLLGTSLKRLADPPPADPGPTEGTLNLAGRWSMTLPKGAKYEVVIHEADQGRFRLEKAVAFTGVYERRGNRLVMVEAAAKRNEGFAWEIRGAEDLTLVAQPPHLGSHYIGTTLKRVGNLPAGEAGPKKGEDSGRTPRAKSPPGGSQSRNSSPNTLLGTR